MKAFNEADFILVCASPGGPAGDEPHKLNTYMHLDRIAVRQLQYRLVLPQPRCPAVSVQLPGCSWDSLPEEAKSLSRYCIQYTSKPDNKAMCSRVQLIHPFTNLIFYLYVLQYYIL